MDPNQIEAAFTDMRNEVQRQRQEILLLKQQLKQQPKQRPKPALPDPEKFSGQQHKFDTWLPSIKAKLRVDGEAIGDEVAQFYYVYLNLESHVQAMVLPQLAQAEKSTSWDFLTILDQLSRVYDNPNKTQEAEDKLFTLRQGTDPVATYIAKFKRVLYEASGQNWPDVNKISILRNGLSATIRNRLSQQLNLPRKYPDFLRVVQQLAGRPSHAHAPGSTSNPQGDPMDTSLGAVISSIDIGPSSPSSPSPTQSQRARSVSPQRRELYRS